MTKNRGESLRRKAAELKDTEMQDKLNAHLGQDMDLVAMDVKYHAPCVVAYLNKRLKAEIVSTNSEKSSAFTCLVEQLYNQLIVNKYVVCLSTIRDTYRTLLKERGLEGAESYRTSSLKRRLLDHFGDTLSFWPQQHGRYSSMFVRQLYQWEMPSEKLIS